MRAKMRNGALVTVKDVRSATKFSIMPGQDGYAYLQSGEPVGPCVRIFGYDVWNLWGNDSWRKCLDDAQDIDSGSPVSPDQYSTCEDIVRRCMMLAGVGDEVL